MLRKNLTAFLAFFIGLLVLTTKAAASPCFIVRVIDGDTLTALCANNQEVKVRLAEIDAPEKEQPFGHASKKSLSDLCYGKQAEITDFGVDYYGRTLGRVMCAGSDANAEQVNRGMAWVYDKYVTDKSLYNLQKTAQEARRGLWRGKDPTPPWEWRFSNRF